jgi:hypothetical protein
MRAAAPEEASVPEIADKPSIWSNDPFSRMRTKTCWIADTAILPASPDAGVLRPRLQGGRLSIERG